jgi:hypothetical protein
MYVQDYDETFPWLKQDNRNNNDSNGFRQGMVTASPQWSLDLNNKRGFFMKATFQPYVKNHCVLICPTLDGSPVVLGSEGQTLNQYGLSSHYGL